MSLLDRLRKENQGESPKAALYARFSSDNQRNESIDAQIRAIKAFAKVQGIVLVEEYVDRAKSATTDDRPEFQRMVKDSSKRNFQLVLVHKLDRFARNRNDSMVYRMKLRKNRVSLLSILEPLDEDRPESIILESVLEGMAEFYSKNLSREVRKGLTENALKCRHTGGSPPLGYSVDKETRRLVINEPEAAAVRMIYQMVLDGFGYDAVLTKLKQAGYKTKAHRDFGKNSLYEILHNPKYKGWYVYNRTASRDPYTKKRNSHLKNLPEDMIIVPGGVPAIVAEEEFDRVQQLLERRKHRCYASKRNKEKYLLAGKIFCGVCGCAYVGNRKNSSGNRKPNITYRCNNRGRRTTTACKNREVNRDYVESFVMNQIENAIFNKRMVGMVLDQFQMYIRKKNMEKSETLHRLEKMIQDCEKKQGNLSDILAEGVDKLQQGILLSKLEKIEHDKLELQGRLEQEKAALDIDVPDKRELEECFIKARMMFREKSLDEMQQLINLYVEKVIVYEDEIQLILNLVPSFYRHDFTRNLHVISRKDLRDIQRKKH